jgi:transposase
MQVVHERAAGMDISKTDAKVAVRVPAGTGGRFTTRITTWAATTGVIRELARMLERERVTVVVMEATGDYWKPFFFVLAETLNVRLVNAKQARNIPGRKTDVSDAKWLAELAAHDLLRASFVPDEPIRQLRDLTRTRAHLVREQNREWSRLEKNLEDSGIKLSSVASSLQTVSCRRILEAMVDGQRDPVALAGLVHASMVKKSAQLVEALTGRFTDHHAFMVKLHLDRIDQIQADVDLLESRINEVIAPFRSARDALTTIPGISTTVACAVIAEIGADMSVFDTPGRLASWAGVCPGQNESAGRIKSTKTRPGDRYLKGALGIAALSISRMNKNRLSVKYKRLAARRGKLKSVVALEHTLIVIIWNMLKTGTAYDDLGPDYYATLNPQKQKNRAIRQLNALGYHVELTPAAA